MHGSRLRDITIGSSWRGGNAAQGENRGKKIVIGEIGIKALDWIISAFDWTLSGDIG
ncbi:MULTISPECIES: hypothetical protein [unclassified Mesorhizobium]|uniref:hypothetical protein n=1 Tax=unclassified Mesorhizobium TaxID=325217 RepID=UPI001651494D|nr:MULTISPECIES: hypothetical protein [unclassified Mesorhizobium]